MSADRDVPATSKTDVQTFPVDGGYVQEVVSVAPPLTTAAGEQATVVTKRRTVTTSSQRSVSPRPSDVASVASYDSSGISAPYTAPREVTLPRTSPAARLSTPSPYRANGSAQWVSMPRPQEHGDAMPTPREPRNVAFGATDTKFVEPSRVSPLHVDGNYAPVRYITKRELRRLRMQAGHETTGMLPRNIRRSSVPRLDAIQRERELTQQRVPTGAAFSIPQGPSFPGAPPAPREEYPGMLQDTEWASPGPRMPVRHDSPQPQRYAFQAGYDDGDTASEQRLRYQRAINLEHAQRAAAADLARQEHELQIQQQMATQRQQFTQQDRYLMQREANFAAEQQRAAAQFHQQQQQQQYAAYAPSLARPIIVPLTPDAQSFEKCTMLVAAARHLSNIPTPPPLAKEAFQLLHRGTYLIKYPSSGSPHERYFTVRIMPSEFRRDLQPYLCWSIHADSQNIKDRLHLAHLIGVSTTDQSENFLRHRIEPGVIRGPYVGGSRQTLPSTYAISLLFQSSSAVRTVDILALDDQTFRCWLLVLRYFAAINTTQDAGSVAPEVETVPPESPRSVSAHSARQ